MQHEQDTIETIFYSEFHPQQGPIIAYSLPFNQPIQKWTEPILDYIIPKADLCNKLITMYHEEHTLITFPVFIENSRYERNAYMFNMAFVMKHPCAYDVYEPSVRKLAYMLERIEREFYALSLRLVNIVDLMKQLFYDLNQFGDSAFSVSGSGGLIASINLSLKKQDSPAEISPTDVPVLIAHVDTSDVSVHRVLICINGVDNVTKISFKASVDLKIVQGVLQHLVQSGCVFMVDAFKFSNVYLPTKSAPNIMALHDKCVNFLFRGSSDTMKQEAKKITPYQLFMSILKLKNMKDIQGIDLRRFVAFCMFHKLIRRKESLNRAQ